jgi:hypothetical protein
VNPTELFDIDNPETVSNTPRPSKTKKPGEVHDVDSASVSTASITPNEEDDGEEIEGTEIEQQKVKYHRLGMKRTHRRKGRFHL